MIIGISGKIGSGKDTVGKIIQFLTNENINKFYTIEHWLKESNEIPYYCNADNFQIKKFAYKLKQIVSLLTGCNIKDLENQDFKNTLLNRDWNYLLGFDGKNSFIKEVKEEDYKTLGINRIKTYTYRDLLQKIGTEAMRNTIHENIWINALFSDYKKPAQIAIEKTGGYTNHKEPYNFPNWIITDVRFPNELKAIENRDGITIRVRKHELYKDTNNVIHVVKDSQKSHPSETALDNANFKYTIDNNGTIEELIEKVKEILIKEKII